MTLLGPAVSRPELTAGLGRLRRMLDGRPSGWRVEYNDAILSDLEPWLISAGFELRERNPLMACRPQTFIPFAADGITLSRLDPGSPPADLEAFQQIRWTDGGETTAPVPPAERLLVELAAASSVYLLAWLDGEPAGTGVSHPLQGAAEIVGVVTRTDRRRRGVAATVTSELVARHFDSGGDFVFLDASGEAAAAVYRRLGFTRFGANLVFGAGEPN
ncbi:MAG TPA: GNAT family N-acetyltransferase [Patescibacteria group bacterium]|nr:GNAT family N-acetyltransferase [Patescibacteria group bacterium]